MIRRELLKNGLFVAAAFPSRTLFPSTAPAAGVPPCEAAGVSEITRASKYT